MIHRFKFTLLAVMCGFGVGGCSLGVRPLPVVIGPDHAKMAHLRFFSTGEYSRILLAPRTHCAPPRTFLNEFEDWKTPPDLMGIGYWPSGAPRVGMPPSWDTANIKGNFGTTIPFGEYDVPAGKAMLYGSWMMGYSLEPLGEWVIDLKPDTNYDLYLVPGRHTYDLAVRELPPDSNEQSKGIPVPVTRGAGYCPKRTP